MFTSDAETLRFSSVSISTMSLIPTVLLGRPATPDPFWDATLRSLAEENEMISQNSAAGGNWRYGIHGPFDPVTGAHEGDGSGIPEIVWPGPPSPGLEPTPMDYVLMEGWGEPNGDRLLYMTGDE